MKYKNIVFYCPSRKVGGNEYLFVRLSEFLILKKHPYRVYYIDYPDGFAHKYLQNIDVHFIDYDRGFSTVIPEESVVVIQLQMISQLKRFEYNRCNTAYIFWCLHKHNIKNQIYIKGHYFLSSKSRKRLGREVKYLTLKGIINFMSQLAYDCVINDLLWETDIKINPLPNVIPIAKHPVPAFKEHSDNEWTFCWLGRLDNELSNNLVSCMNDLEAISNYTKVKLYVVGIGVEENILREKAITYSYPIEFLGERRGEMLDDAINKSDIGLAIGTSAFEFVIRGKPIIMSWTQDKEYAAMERRDYTFIYHSETNDDILSYGDTLKAKFNEIRLNYIDVARKSYEFALQKSPDVCVDKLKKCIEHLEILDMREEYYHIDNASRLINRGSKRINFLSKVKHIFD